MVPESQAGWDFARLVQEYFSRAVRFCARMLGDIGEGEEVAQQAFVQLLEKGHRPWEKGDPLPYLFAVLRNACVDHVRKRKRRSAEGDANEVAAPGRDLSNAEAHEIRHALLEAVAKLEQAQREVILLRFFEGMELADVATTTGRTLGATAMLITRAKAKLKEMLGRLPAFQDEP